VNFEHLVVINDLADPLLGDLSREELWFGLLCRAEDPRAFLPGLEHCTILERSDSALVRELRFGNAVIRDRVTLVAMQSVCFDTERTASHAGGSLTIAIEEPAPRQLVLRFRYRTTLPDDAESPDRAYAEYVKSAYYQSDLDTVRVIRMLAESGRCQ
jgi:hypothetical protein